jgi:DNA-binding transcriptional LysR family regulator
MHDINWDDLRYFAEVVRSGNVSQAGERIGVNQSTVSRRIASLESQLGKTLFDRTSNGWVITPTGETIVTFAEQMATKVNDIQRKVEIDSDEVSGLVRITCVDVCVKRFMLPVIRDFKQVHPNVDIELISDIEPLNLAAREADVALRGTNAPPPNLVGKRIGTLTFHVYGHVALFKNGLPEQPPCITWIGDGNTLSPWIKKNFPKVKRAYRTNSIAVMYDMCKAGLGLAQLSCAIADEVEELIRIPVEYVEPGFGLWVLSHVDLRTTARVRIFRDFLVEYLTKELDLIEGRKPRVC